eukprot:14921100-Heterocapsa_arctica.AAC.1
MRRFITGMSFETDSVKSSRHRALDSCRLELLFLNVSQATSRPLQRPKGLQSRGSCRPRRGDQIRSHKYCMTELYGYILSRHNLHDIMTQAHLSLEEKQ